MSVVEEATNSPVARVPARKRWQMMVLVTFVPIVGTLVVCVGVLLGSKPLQPIRVALGNGQFLQIEKVAYGTHHHFGGGLAFAGRFTRKLPIKLQRALGVDSLSGFELERPALVIWLSAFDEATGTNVDCRGIYGQLMDKEGEAFTFSSRSFGKPGNGRSAAVLYDYPRGDTNLTLQVGFLRSLRSQIVSVDLPNPYAVKPANWSGQPLPQSKVVGDVEIVLRELRVQQVPKRTGVLSPLAFPPASPSSDALRRNSGELRMWNNRMRAAFAASGECFSEGKPATGWAAPQWTSEDRFGNKATFAATNEPVVKFCATVYPEATNSRATQLVATFPQTDLSITSSNIIWNQTNSAAQIEIVTLGLFQPGTHTFSNGLYQMSSAELSERRTVDRSLPIVTDQRIPTVPRVTLGSSGWDYSARPIMTGGGAYYIRNHSTYRRTIYVRALKLSSSEKIGVRFRDDHGRNWSARAEPVSLDRIQPFYIDLPADATNIVTEVVVLKPLQAEFLVDTRNSHKL